MRLDGPPPGDLCPALPIPHKVEALAKVAHAQFHLSIQNEAKARFRIMMDNKDHRSTEIRVGHLRHGHKK